MGRGSSNLRGMAAGAAGTFGNDYGELKQERAGLRGSLLPRLNEWSSASELPEEQATKARTLEAIDAAAGAGNQQMENRVARTHNSAGAFANEAANANTMAQNKAGALRDLAGQRLQRRQGALSQLGQMYGIDTNFVGNTGNLQVGALDAYGRGIGKWSAPFGISAG